MDISHSQELASMEPMARASSRQVVTCLGLHHRQPLLRGRADFDGGADAISHTRNSQDVKCDCTFGSQDSGEQRDDVHRRDAGTSGKSFGKD